MATARITEFEFMPKDGDNYPAQIAKEPAITTQNVTYTTSTASAAFNSKTRFIRIDCNAIGHIVVGSAPTAAATDERLQADTPEFRGVFPGQKIAIYDGTS